MRHQVWRFVFWVAEWSPHWFAVWWLDTGPGQRLLQWVHKPIAPGCTEIHWDVSTGDWWMR